MTRFGSVRQVAANPLHCKAVTGSGASVPHGRQTAAGHGFKL